MEQTKSDRHVATVSPLENQVTTVFLRCSAIHSRGELVNQFLYSFRSQLGIESWFTSENVVDPCVPLEVVEVRNSKKPFFLIEFRYPFAEELQRRSSTAVVPDAKVSEALLIRITDALLALREVVMEYNHSPLLISTSSSLSVSEQRSRHEARDALRKRSREEDEKENAVKKQRVQTTSFIPRSVRHLSNTS